MKDVTCEKAKFFIEAEKSTVDTLKTVSLRLLRTDTLEMSSVTSQRIISKFELTTSP